MYRIDAILDSLTTREDWEIMWEHMESRSKLFEANCGRDFHIGDLVSFYVKKGRDAGLWKGTITKMSTIRATITVENRRYASCTIPYSWLGKI